jgi:hypothetical protein
VILELSNKSWKDLARFWPRTVAGDLARQMSGDSVLLATSQGPGRVEQAWWQSAPSTNTTKFMSQKTLDIPHSALQKAAGDVE